MHELRHLELDSSNQSPNRPPVLRSEGRLRVSALDATQSARAAEVASKLLGVEQLPTAVVFVEGAPGCIRLPPRWKDDKPALTAERLLRAVNLARAKALGGQGRGAAAAAASARLGPPLELVAGAHSPVGRELLGLAPLWGQEEEEAEEPAAALERELVRRATGQDEEAASTAPPSEASVVASAKAAMGATTPPNKPHHRQKQKPQQPRPTPLSSIAPSSSSATTNTSTTPYWSQPGKAQYWGTIAALSLLLLAWEGFGLQRRFEKFMLARRTAQRARGVKFPKYIDDMDATDLLMDTIERAGAARARQGRTTTTRRGGLGGFGPGARRAAAATGGTTPSSSSSTNNEDAAQAAAIDVVATDVVGGGLGSQEEEGSNGQQQQRPPPPRPPPPPDASAR
jgi:hypothetical protein